MSKSDAAGNEDLIPVFTSSQAPVPTAPYVTTGCNTDYDSAGVPTATSCTTWTVDPQASVTSDGGNKNSQTAGGQTQAPVPTTPATPATASPSTFSGQTTAVAATAAANATSSKGVSNGAVAGIAIGTAILGAAIAFLIAFFLFQRRKPSQKLSNPSYESVPELDISAGKAIHSPYVQEVSQIPPPALAAAAVSRSPQGHGQREDVDLANLASSNALLAGILPPVADDMTIRSRISELFEQMQRHVESFYRDVHASITPSMEDDLAQFGNGTSGMGMLDMLQSFSSPTVAIKHALATYIMNITAPEGRRGESIFPREIIGMAGKEKVLRSTSDLSPAYILYRQLATTIYTTLNPLHTTANPSASSLSLTTSLASRIQEAAEHFAITFFPWANPAYSDSDKDGDLVHIITSALELMLWLHGQPYVYEFNWEGVGRRGTVIAPGLARLTDGKGRDEGPQHLLEPIVIAT